MKLLRHPADESLQNLVRYILSRPGVTVRARRRIHDRLFPKPFLVLRRFNLQNYVLNDPTYEKR